MTCPRLARRIATLLGAAALLLSLPAVATASASPETGWIRLAHLSPDVLVSPWSG